MTKSVFFGLNLTGKVSFPLWDLNKSSVIYASGSYTVIVCVGEWGVAAAEGWGVEMHVWRSLRIQLWG